MIDVLTREEAEDFFGTLYRGRHHIPGNGVKPEGNWAWVVNHYIGLSTYDYDELTRLVFLAHDRCVRAEVLFSGPRMVKIRISKRSGRTGNFAERHPTIEQALADWRTRNPMAVAEPPGDTPDETR